MGKGMSDLNLPQPFGFYHHLSGADDLHFGYWPDEKQGISLSEAQHALTGLLVDLFPKPPARVLDVGCGLGATAERLHQAGYHVVAIAPSDELIAVAKKRHPGPEYLTCGFLDDHTRLNPPDRYDVVLFQESLQYFPQLIQVFQKAKTLLAPKGRLILCDEVSYSPETRRKSAVHLATDIEQSLGEVGFCVRQHRRIGLQVQRTCHEVLKLFEAKQVSLIETFGTAAKELIDHYVRGWERQLDWYGRERFGYEIWDACPDRFTVRPYVPGDEEAILGMFRQVFDNRRTLEHWRWKFRQNPFGGPYITTVWENKTLVTHYAAYPVPFWMEDHMDLTYQVGDTMTLPSHRGVGRGPTSLLARAVRLFHRLYCEGRICFFYGFNTGKIQKFGKMFLQYVPAAPVYEWTLEGEGLSSLATQRLWKTRLSGFDAGQVREVGAWADVFFEKVRPHYGWLVARTASYLKWRYFDHPDYDYTLMMVRRWGRVVGWFVGRIEGNTLLIGDALFARHAKQAVQVGLASWVRGARGQGVDIREIRGWFSRQPEWWSASLSRLGFQERRQRQSLDFCVTTFVEDMSPEKLSQQVYFTQGDSDLF